MVAPVVPVEQQKVVVLSLAQARGERRMVEALIDPRRCRYFQAVRSAVIS